MGKKVKGRGLAGLLLESHISGLQVRRSEGSQAGPLLEDIFLVQLVPEVISSVPLLPSKQIPESPPLSWDFTILCKVHREGNVPATLVP